MGDLLPTPSPPNPTPTTMSSSSSSSSQTQEPKSQPDPTHQPKPEETPKNPPVNTDPETPTDEEDPTNFEPEDEEEEEGECGFCLFMKAGGCRDSFIEWEKCIEAGEKNNEDIVEKCFEVTAALKKCMEAHTDYYDPILRAEKAAQEEAMRELEGEKGKEKEGYGSVPESAGTEKSESS